MKVDDAMKLKTKSVKVPINKLTHWLDLRDGDVEVQDLRDSLVHLPMLQDVLVRARATGTNEYEVIDGWRRVKAASLEGHTEIDVTIMEGSDDEMELVALESNFRRKTLPDEIKAMVRIVELYKKISVAKRGGDRRSKAFRERSNGHDGQMIGKSPVALAAKATGKSPRTASRMYTIGTKGSAKVKEALAKGEINQNQAERLANLPTGQDSALEQVLENTRTAVAPTYSMEGAVQAISFAINVIKVISVNDNSAEELMRLTCAVSELNRAVEQLEPASSSAERAFGSIAEAMSAVSPPLALDGFSTALPPPPQPVITPPSGAASETR